MRNTAFRLLGPALFSAFGHPRGTAVLFAIVLAAMPPTVDAQVVERSRPPEWDRLVFGGQFKDLYQPMPVRNTLTDRTWGGDNVKPRDIRNGIEDPSWSYWGGCPIRDNDGRYHLFVSRWPESHPDGHFGYFDSEIVHAAADDPFGPYTVLQRLGEGHNPEIYRSAAGKYVVYSTHGRYFVADDLNGPWKRRTYDFHKRQRYVFPNYVNFSFARRSDGSYIAVSRRGYIWVSPDGEEDWYNVSAEPVYPKVEGIFEDPVLWRDEVQYHIIVNDWKGRIAYYLRSKDGFHWKTEPGEAYTPGIARYEDGTVSDWFKFERLRFLFDEYGRPTHAFFAVIDTAKADDQPNDEHNSKTIVLPMRLPRRAVIVTSAGDASSRTIHVKLLAEPGFRPAGDLDFDSLRFGASERVNYGGGARVVSWKPIDDGVLLTFHADDTGLNDEHFAAKLLGKDRRGDLVYAWAAIPTKTERVPLLSPLAPHFEREGDRLVAYVEVQNFGQIDSPRAAVELSVSRKGEAVPMGTAPLRPLKPFEKAIVRIECPQQSPSTRVETTVAVETPGFPRETFTKAVSVPGR
ncbi:glycoside hydrolase family protein [Thermostilla marina]